MRTRYGRCLVPGCKRNNNLVSMYESRGNVFSHITIMHSQLFLGKNEKEKR